MSRRFRGVLPLALIAVTALAAGCDDRSTPQAAPGAVAAASAAPSPSPSAYLSAGEAATGTCTDLTKIVSDGSVEIADNAVKSIDEKWSSKKVADQLRASFAKMAKQVAAEVPQVSDPAQRAAVQKIADRLAEGGRASKPEAFLKKDFQSLGDDLGKVCLG